MLTCNICTSTQDFCTYCLSENASNKHTHINFLSSKARDLDFGLSLHLHSSLVYASSKGSVKSVHMSGKEKMQPHCH